MSLADWDDVPADAWSAPTAPGLFGKGLARSTGSLSALITSKVAGLGFMGTVVSPAADVAFCEVLDGLYISSGCAAAQLKELKARKVTHVVNAAPSIELNYHPEHVQYLVVDVLDGPQEPIGAHFERVNAWVHAARTSGGCVLVHCHGGVSRAAALVLAYLMKSEGLGYEMALARLRSARPVVQPNPGFVQQLLAFEQKANTLARDDSSEWPELGVPGSVPAPCAGHRRLTVKRSLSAHSSPGGPETPPGVSEPLLTKLLREAGNVAGQREVRDRALKRSASL